MLESHDQNDAIGNLLDLSGTICKGHVQKLSKTFFPDYEYFTLMLFIGHPSTIYFQFFHHDCQVSSLIHI